MRGFKPVRVKGEIVPDYWVSLDGRVFSTKRGYLHELSVSPPTKHCNYPKVNISVRGKMKTFMVHQLVCEAFHKFPAPTGITKAEWKATPVRVQLFIGHNAFQVNHIDHDCNNFHPSNLEWVTPKENAEKRESHRLQRLQRLKKAA